MTEPTAAPHPDITNPITPRIAQHVLWHYGLDGGLEPSDFVKKLLSTIAVADVPNRVKLSHGFLGYVMAAFALETNPDAVRSVQRIAQQDPYL